MKSVFNSLRAICAMLLGTKLDRGFCHCKKQSIYASDVGRRSTDDQISRKEQNTVRIGRFFIYYTSFEQTRNPAKKSSLNLAIGVGMAHAPFCAILCPKVLPASFTPLTYQAKSLNPNLLKIHNLFFL